MCKQVGTNESDLFEVIENIHHAVSNRSIKIKVKKLSNLLSKRFQTKECPLNKQ